VGGDLDHTPDAVRPLYALAAGSVTPMSVRAIEGCTVVVAH
jgi:hypothetical protein